MHFARALQYWRRQSSIARRLARVRRNAGGAWRDKRLASCANIIDRLSEKASGNHGRACITARACRLARKM